MTIKTGECIGLALIWASDLFQRVQAPILSYNVNLQVPYDRNFVDEPYDPLAPVTTKLALRSLRIACQSQSNCKPISLSQINANFKDLVSLSLSRVAVRSTKELTLPQLEFLYIESTLLTGGWDLPRLRHVCLDCLSSPSDLSFHMVVNPVRRYASHLESLLLEKTYILNGFPADFWDAFPALRLFGLPYDVLGSRYPPWQGWDVRPPQSHPLRYLVCVSFEAPALADAADELKGCWTYHGGVALVIQGIAGVYYLIEDAKQMAWSRETNGILTWTPSSYLSRIPERPRPESGELNTYDHEWHFYLSG